MQKVVKEALHAADRNTLEKHAFQSLVVLMRILFGVGWLLAGVTKILGKGGSTGHSWFAQPGIFLSDYLIKTLDKPNVPDFYKFFIEEVAIKQVLVLNYAIPIIQVLIGLFLILGFMTLPSILTCLFMHINFLLSGNINLLSIILYTSAFGLLLSGKQIYMLSLDQYFKLDNILNWHINKSKNSTSNTLETFSQNERIEQFITYIQETHYNENNRVDKKIM